MSICSKRNDFLFPQMTQEAISASLAYSRKIIGLLESYSRFMLFCLVLLQTVQFLQRICISSRLTQCGRSFIAHSGKGSSCWVRAIVVVRPTIFINLP